MTAALSLSTLSTLSAVARAWQPRARPCAWQRWRQSWWLLKLETHQRLVVRAALPWPRAAPAASSCPSMPPHRVGVCRSASSAADAGGQVVELDEETFGDFVKAAPAVLVLYHAPWCEHCEEVRPEWQRAADVIKERAMAGRLGMVDASVHQDLALSHGVQQLPAMHLYVDGQLQAHVNARRAEDVVDLLQHAVSKTRLPLAAPAKKRSDMVRLGRDELQPFLSKKKHAFVLYYKPGESDQSDQLVDTFEKASATLAQAAQAAPGPGQGEVPDAASVTLVAVDCAEEPVLCATMLGGSATPVIKYYHFLDRAGPDNQYDGRLQIGELSRFVSSRGASGTTGPGQDGVGGGLPDPDSKEHWADVEHREAVVLLNDATFDEILARSGHVLVFFYAPWCAHCSSVKHTYARAARDLEKDGHLACLAAVDFSSNPLLEKRFRLEFLPAFKLFHAGKFIGDHHRLRNREEFIGLMKNIAQGKSV